MTNMFKKFLKNKYFYIWILIFIIILYFIFNPILKFKGEYMEIKKIKDFIYIFYVFLLPISFYDMGFASCFLLDICYLSIIMYMVVNFINYFFVDSATTTLTRIDRNKWIHNILKINFIYSLFSALVYIIIFIILCLINNISVELIINNIIPMVYKILITLIIPNLYLLFYIKTDSSIISLSFSSIFYILIELLIKGTFKELTLKFQYPIIIIMLLTLIYLSICSLVFKTFKRRDL